MIGGVGSTSYVGGQACVVLDESPRPGGVLPGDGSTDMMSALVTTSGTTRRARPVEAPREPLRLRLKPKAPTGGWVDGGWWPRSRDLGAELPGLLAVLAVRLGRIERVSYHLGDWGPTGAKISCGVGVVRLGGYRTQRADTVDVLAAGSRVTLLVVPPETSTHIAHAVLMAAGHRGSTDDVETLLRSRPLAPRVLVGSGSEAEAAHERWELDGGRVTVDDHPPGRTQG
jgi:Family of unknown function (DUF5994)